ncbi:type III-A CRISPR-associated protein Csm2 [Calorimonas adulescens]|uniref:CRISPR system Cms protein Csm2 n=1 Tax=Calorimonas adulescens TaxID=2606906 RepID=A0A5D8QAW1_9THEO|nr:type III-A CRISPR-associated protein Csm2 [Calorimonas adulescens]TZE81602.1 type III-A CRISPR-associated protein Csm2 [Calorimonas adulescens]
MNTEDILLEAIRYRIFQDNIGNRGKNGDKKDRDKEKIEEILNFDLSDVEDSKVEKLRQDYENFLNSISDSEQARQRDRHNFRQSNTKITPSILYIDRRAVTEDSILKYITDFLKSKDINDISDRDIVFLGRALANIAIAHDAKNTEMRRFLDSTKKIRNNYVNRSDEFRREYLLSLKVNFDYFATRHTQLKEIVNIIDVFISRITDDGIRGFNQFLKLDRLIEALIVYHKVYGGREK